MVVLTVAYISSKVICITVEKRGW